MEWFFVPVAIFVVILPLIYRYATRNFSYWSHRRVTFLKPLPLVGSRFISAFVRKEHVGVYFCRIATKNKGKPYLGYISVKFCLE